MMLACMCVTHTSSEFMCMYFRYFAALMCRHVTKICPIIGREAESPRRCLVSTYMCSWHTRILFRQERAQTAASCLSPSPSVCQTQCGGHAYPLTMREPRIGSQACPNPRWPALARIIVMYSLEADNGQFRHMCEGLQSLLSLASCHWWG